MEELRLGSGSDDNNTNGSGEIVIDRIWERQPGETNRSFAAFSDYLQMGPQRSLVKLGQKQGKNRALLEGWSRKHDWQRRVAAYQRYENRIINDRIVDGVASMRERQALLGQQLQSRAQARILRMTETEVNELHPVDAAMMMRVGSELERKAREVEEGAYLGGWDVPAPQFTVQIVRPGCDAEGNRMIAVQITSGPSAGRFGYIPADRVAEFRRDHPDWRVLT